MSPTCVQQNTEQHMALSCALTPLQDHGSLHTPVRINVNVNMWCRAGVCGVVVKGHVIARTSEGDGDVEDTGVGFLCPPDLVLGYAL